MMSVLSRVAEDIEKTITHEIGKAVDPHEKLRVFIRLCMEVVHNKRNIIRLWTSGPKSTKEEFDRSSLNIIGNSVLHALRLSKRVSRKGILRKSMQWVQLFYHDC